MPSSGAGEHVGRVVHAEVGTAQREGQGEEEDASAASGVDPGHRRRHGERGGRVRGGEAERAGRAAERRQPLEHRPRPLDDQLDHIVEPDRDRPERGADQPGLAVGGVERSPARSRSRTRSPRCCRALPRALISSLERRRVPAGAHRAQQLEVESRHRRRRIIRLRCPPSPATPTRPAITAARPRCATCSASTASRSARRWPSGSAPAPASTTSPSRTPRRAAGSTAAPRGSRRTSAS